MNIKKQSAIALILSVGIIAVLTMISIGLSAFTRLELLATENQVNAQKAELIAEAGIAQAIGDIKYHVSNGAKNESYDSPADPWYYRGNSAVDGPSIDLDSASMPSYGNDINFGGGSYRLKVIDCAAMININCAFPNSDAESDLVNMLRELGLSGTQAQNIVSLRKTLPDQVFTTKQEIKLANNISQADYDSIKDFITIWGDDDDGITSIDRASFSAAAGHSRKSYVNINTAPLEVLQAVLRPMVDSPSQANALARAIKTKRASNPFDGLPDAALSDFLSARGEFERFLETASSSLGLNIISVANKNSILRQSDPNSYDTSSTKLGFDANGCYEIECIGNYRSAVKRIKKSVFVFRRIYQTTKNEFSTNSSAVTTRVSWKNSCPVDFTKLMQYSYADDPTENPNTGDYIYDSIKLGFWDNFSEDYELGNRTPDGSGVLGPWTALEQTFTINDSDSGWLETWAIGGASYGIDYHPRIALDPGKCSVDDFALIAHGRDEVSKSKYSIRDNLPWPAVPQEWTIRPPMPDNTNCPDTIGDPALLALLQQRWLRPGEPGWDPTIPRLSLRHHQQYLNTLHIQFGGYRPGIAAEEMSAIFCNNIQDKGLLNNQDAYRQWINYDGSDYIYFCPAPVDTSFPLWEWFQTSYKSQDVLRTGNVMVTCNTWPWWGHPADNGTQHFPISGGGYQREKTFHVKGIGNRDDPYNKFRGEVYFSGGLTTPFSTSEVIMVGDDRYFRISGLGNLPDIDYFRVVPEQGVYTTNLFSPAATLGSGTHLEWATIRAHVSLPGTADTSREPVYLVVSDSGFALIADPTYEPASYFLPSGGPIGTTASQSIAYQAYLFSDKGETNKARIDFEQAPVLEDVTITYMPKTVILSQTNI